MSASLCAAKAVSSLVARGRGLAPLLLLAALVFPGFVKAEIGKASVVEGKAERVSASGETVRLAVGTPIELGDVIRVAAKANLKVTLTDGSVLMVGEDSELRIEEARFDKLDRKGFRAQLLFGRVWSNVKRALGGSDAKFEITTQRAVAGVRGTIFRVDVVKMASAASPRPKATHTRVRVMDGKVRVDAKVRKVAQAPKVEPVQQGPRRQIAKPAQVTKEQWEDRFTELQRNQEVRIGTELWQQVQFDPGEKDAFASFVEKNGGAAAHED